MEATKVAVTETLSFDAWLLLCNSVLLFFLTANRHTIKQFSGDSLAVSKTWFTEHG